MRLVDVDVLGQNDIPLEVRMDLRRGDHVGLYEEVSHPSMGSGYSPIEAVVLGSPEPGWFVGSTADGEEVVFHAGNVADVLYGSPSMGGIFDWLKKPKAKEPGIIALPQGPQPPGVPLEPEERRSLISQVKSFFLAPFKTDPTKPRKSIFDVAKPAEPKSGELIPKGPSLVSVVREKQGRIIPAPKIFQDIIKAAAPSAKPLVPFVQEYMAPIVATVPASPELAPYVERRAQEKELWASIIPAEPKAPERSVQELVAAARAAAAPPPIPEAYQPSEVQPASEVLPPKLREKIHRDVKILPLPRRGALLPSVEDLARGLVTTYQPISDLWDLFRYQRETAEWQDSLDERGYAKYDFETLGNCGGSPNVFEEVSTYFHIPWEELRKRAGIVQEGKYETWANTDLIWMEVIQPAMERLEAAFAILKPADLPGKVIVERADAHGPHEDPCVLSLTYIEGDPEKQEDPQPSAAVAEEGAEQEEESVEELQSRLERETWYFIEQRDKLNPKDPEYKEKLEYLNAEIDQRREMIRQIMEDLTEGRESKRSPEKKKPSKRGRKKGK